MDVVERCGVNGCKRKVREGGPCFQHQIRSRVPEIRTGEVDYEIRSVNDPRFFLPRDKPFPQVWVKFEPLPCINCRRIRMDHGGRAVMCKSSGAEVAFFQCKACDCVWQLPVRKRDRAE